jgi:hypothetical protein
MGMKFLLGGWLNLLEMKKRRAWVQGGLGTSTTLHARHLWGRASRQVRSAAGYAARATCFVVLALMSALAFRRACCARV